MPIDIKRHAVYNFLMKNKNLIGERPPLSPVARQQIGDIMEFLNQDALLPFTPKNTLDLIIDRAWCAINPGKVSPAKRKKYEKFPF